MHINLGTIDLILLLITLHALFLAASMAVGQLIKDIRSTSNRLFFGLFVIFVFWGLHYILFKTGLLERYPLFYVLGIPPFYLLGPLMYLLSKFVLGIRDNEKNRNWLHFIPVMLATLDAVMIILILEKKPMQVLSGYFYNKHIFYLGGLGSLLIFIYLVLTWKLLRRKFIWGRANLRQFPGAIMVYVMLCLFSVALVVDGLMVITGQQIFLEISILLVNGIIFFLFLINFKYPDFQKIITNEMENEKRQRSYLTGLDLRGIENKLIKIMVVGKIYLQEDITLSRLAKEVAISSHQLSEYLNTRHKKNFQGYINTFRIKMAKQHLLEDNRTVLNIAFEVGFKSKSAFNTVFLKETGVTPSVFRKNNKKQS